MKYKRTYIDVIAAFSKDGLIIPIEFLWHNGRRYKIDKVLDVKPRPSMKVGGIGNRYTVRINGKEHYMFLEYPDDPTKSLGRWFVEEAVINDTAS